MKITKTPKRLAPPIVQVSHLLQRIQAAADDELPAILDPISEWCWPRGDLHYWSSTLNRFDDIFEETCKDYELFKLQLNEFTPNRKRLLVSILRFSRLLMENCTNRKLYASYERLHDLLLTRDLDILEETLRLLLRPAQQHSASGGARNNELAIAQGRLSTLAVIWTPRDFGISMLQLSKDDFPVPPEADSVRFSFYRRKGGNEEAGPSNAAISAAVLSTSRSQAAPMSVDPMAMSLDLEDLRANTSFGTPSRLPRSHSRVGSSSQGATSGPTDTPAQGSACTQGSTQEGMVTIDMRNITASGKSCMDVVADAIETHKIPETQHFELFQRVRAVFAMRDAESRHKLLTCRLLAISCYAHTVSESVANAHLFLFEPEAIRGIADLISLESTPSMRIASSALYALDGLAKFRTKTTDVFNAVSVSVNHGMLLQNVRLLIEKLTEVPSEQPQSGPQKQICNQKGHGDLGHYADAVFTMVAAVTTFSGPAMTVASAGLMPLLVHIIRECKSRRYLVQRSVSRAIGLIDSLVYALPTAFNIFCEAHGQDVYVARIEEEVEFDIQHPESDTEVLATPRTDGEADSRDNLYGKLSFGGASLLRNLFKSIAHMMTSAGTAEGLRNLIDTSLLESIRKIMTHRRTFGPQILSLAINIMANFVHNEPTSLATIQEKKLPEKFFEVVEEDIEANFEVIAAIPNAIGAICLNQTGLNLFNSKPVVEKLIDLLVSDRHVEVLEDRENATMFGTAIDELVRHHPSVKDKVISSLLRALTKIIERGSEWSADKDQPPKNGPKLAGPQDTAPQIYDLEMVPASVESPADSFLSRQPSVTLSDLIMDETETNTKKEDPATVNAAIAAMDAMARFLEGFFQTPAHCKDFVRADGLDLIFKFYELPCLPYNFCASFTADSLVALLRAMTEMSAHTVLGLLTKEVRKSLAATKHVWLESRNNGSGMIPLLSPRTKDEFVNSNQSFRQLVTLNARINLLSDLCQHFTYAGSRMPSTFLQNLNSTNVSAPTSLLEDLGQLLQDCMWENLMLKASTPSPASAEDKEMAAAKPTKFSGLSEDIIDEVPGASPSKKMEAEIGSKGAKSHQLEKLPEALKQNTTVLRYLASQIPACLNFLFHELVRLLFYRRNPDEFHKAQAATAATTVAKALSQSLVWRDSKNPCNDFAFATLMIDYVDGLIYDFKSSAHGGVHILVLSALEGAGGVDRLLEMFLRYAQEVDLHFEGERKIAESEEDVIRLGHACGGLRVCLHLMQNLVASKPLLDSPQLVIIQQGGVDSFNPSKFIVTVRARFLRAIKSVWDKDWLFSLPLLINRWLVKIVLVIVRGEGEEEEQTEKPSSSSRLSVAGLSGGLSVALAGLTGARSPLASSLTGITTPHTPIVADETRVSQLSEMGFPTASARRALQRTHNSSSAALEYLLTHPALVDNPPEEPELTAPSATAAAIESATTGLAEASTGVPPPSSETQSAGTHDAGAADVSLPTQTPESSVNASSGMEGMDVDRPASATEKGKEKVHDDGVINFKEDLDALRAQMKEHVCQRILTLADHHEALVFDAKEAFAVVGNSVTILDELVETLPKYFAERSTSDDRVIKVRLHLLALILNDAELAKQVDEARATRLMRAVSAVERLDEASGASYSLLVAAFLFTLAERLKEVPLLEESAWEKGEVAVKRGLTGGLFKEEAKTHLGKVIAFLRDNAATADNETLLAVYRLLVVITRRSDIALAMVQADGIAALLAPIREGPIERTSGCQSYIIMILRHIIEDNAVLKAVMQQNLRCTVEQARTKSINSSSLLSYNNSSAWRDADVFIKVVEESLTMDDYSKTQQSGLLSLKVNTTSEDDISNLPDERGNVNGKPEVPNGDVQKPTPAQATEQSDLVITHLMAELMSAPLLVAHSTKSEVPAASVSIVTKDQDQEASKIAQEEIGKSEEEKKSDVRHFYYCFIMQLLAELLSSYDSCKLSFLSYNKKRPAISGAPPPKARSGALNYFYNELVFMSGKTSQAPASEFRQGKAISNLSMSVIVALTADTASNIALKDVNPELITVRKLVLDGLSKALREVPLVAESPESNYGKISMLSDLCYRLLTAKPNSTGTARQNEDLSLHMAKLMLEKNFVAALTAALADIDLNLPIAKPVLESVLKPLEHLAKVSIRMGKPEKKGAATSQSAHRDRPFFMFPREGRDEEDEDMSPEFDEDSEGALDEEERMRDETPDFYRNSSLGMHTGDLEAGAYDEEMSEDEMDEDEEDVDMEEYDSDETGSDLSSSDEEEDEDDIEVIDMDDDDDEEDIDDEGLDDLDEDDEDAWTDDEEASEGDEDAEELDFVLEVGEEMEGLPRPSFLADGVDDAQPAEAFSSNIFGSEPEEDIDDDGDDSVDDQYDNGDFAELELDERYPATLAPSSSDRFGANWAWASNQTTARGTGGIPYMFVGRSAGNSSSADHWPSTSRLLEGSSRTGRGSRNDDVASHPLLEDRAPDSAHQSSPGQRLPRRRLAGGAALGGGQSRFMNALEAAVGGGAMQFLEAVLSRAQQSLEHEGIGEELRVSITTPGDSGAPRIHVDGLTVAGNAASGQRSNRPGTRTEPQARDPISALQEFVPMSTAARWQQEASIIYGLAVEKLERPNVLKNEIHNLFLPAYWRRKREQQARDAEAKAEKERQEKEKKEKQEQQEKDKEKQKLKQEEDKASRVGEGEEQSASASTTEITLQSGQDVEMEDESQPNLELGSLEQGLAELSNTDAGRDTIDGADADVSTGGSGHATEHPSQPPVQAVNLAGPTSSTTQRITVMIHGREVDITDSGIDVEFLEALPDDMREEIVEQHLRERQAASLTSGQNTSIAPEFLEALPPDIRAEVIQQELISNRVRAARNASRPSGEADAGAEEDDEGQNEPGDDDHGGPNASHASRPAAPVRSGTPPAADEVKKPPPRDAIQLLDKAGLATLVRLLFFPQLDARSSGLHRVLTHLTENARTRSELLNLLLMILWDGASDTAAVDKSYAAMSAKITKAFATPIKTTGKKGLTTPGSLPPHLQTPTVAPISGTGDEAPYLIALRCVECLLGLAGANEQVSEYFLKEDARPSKKGKGKDKDRLGEKFGNAPIGTLLALLERPVILQHASLLDSLIALLNTVSKPLANQPKQSEEPAGSDKKEAPDAAPEVHESGTGQMDAAHASNNNGAEPEAGPSTNKAADASDNGQKEQKGLFLTAQRLNPHLPADRLSAVVKPLGTAISSRGFQNTLSVASNLAHIDGAREVISDSFKRSAEAASHSLMADLDALLQALPPRPAALPATSSLENEDAPMHSVDGTLSLTAPAPQGSGTATSTPMNGVAGSGEVRSLQDISAGKAQSPALASLASPSSAQAVFLRSLRALDYLLTGK
ncbi:DUF913-domain-containing protein [Tilletiaria anomala UBC 951]|uniref:DUF913-domain-containing protein n=1 Tax=Tilletiaria anomala (strain ATCC 24038 / CBS 436.72 / UBC 951) TaxID=1037660 RepID=A0A066WMQ7_TILAU|nr:DUF913-domain-containing protein [Tilletiaria anomala UBC 951]KDN52289.1 DUF913-domain-containing protein [Tilletiaria anomala UBC 951]